MTPTPEARPFAYIRKSIDRGDGTVLSYEIQEQAIREMARRHGDEERLVVLTDAGRSGGSRKGRTGYAALWEAIETGRCSAIYAYNLSRVARSVTELATVFAVSGDEGIPLRFVQDAIDTSTASGKLTAHLLAAIAQFHRDLAVESSNDLIRQRMAREDEALGFAPYGYRIVREEGDGRVILVPDPGEPLEPLLEALRETEGRILTACRLLSERGIPTRLGGPWDPRVLARIIDRESELGRPLAREFRKVRVRRVSIERPDGSVGAKRVPLGRGLLSRLVRCHCGSFMTPNERNQQLTCHRGHKAGVAGHGRYVTQQRHVIQALYEATHDLRGRTGSRTYATQAGASKRQEIEEELRRLGRAYRAGAVDDGEFDVESRRLQSELERTATTEADLAIRVATRGRLVKWSELAEVKDGRVERVMDPTTLGAQLRELVEEVRLDEAMQPAAVNLRG